MKCPNCGKACKKGRVEVRNAGSLTQGSSMATWYPQESNGKILKKGAVELNLNATGYYCDECMKVYAEFDEK